MDKIILHENYDTMTLENDIGLMKLQRPISFNAHVSPICLPTFDFDSGTVCYVTGWGLPGITGKKPDILQETTVPLMDHATCKTFYQNVLPVTSQMRCAGQLGQSQGTCLGDSGGPLACERGGRWYLLGITSWASGGCQNEGDPGVFADIFYFRNWIKETIRNGV